MMSTSVGVSMTRSLGASRNDRRSGVTIILHEANGTAVFIRGRELGEEEPSGPRQASSCRPSARPNLYDEKRAERAARDAERTRTDALPLALYPPDLKLCNGRCEDLRDQLNLTKHTDLGKTGFGVSQPNRTPYILQLQVLTSSSRQTRTRTTSTRATPASTAA
eukprot:6179056-Pleurochrysis_carterae.AAC.1